MNDINPTNYDWGIRPLHEKLLEMMIDFNAFCERYNIDYCLAYGTALGALRHNGFIPWDDDVDLYMTYDSYNKFKKYFKKYGDLEKYYFQELDEIEGMVTLSKIRMNNTTYIEPLYKDSGNHQGIYLDIFILHNAPHNCFKRRIQCFANQYLVLKGLSNRHYKNKRLYIPLLVLLSLTNNNFGRKRCLKSIYKYDTLQCDTYFDVDLRSYKKSFFSKSLIFPLKKVEFEGVFFPVPGKLEEYLIHVYGDYKKIPDIDSIRKSQHSYIWDVDKNYTEYI